MKTYRWTGLLGLSLLSACGGGGGGGGSGSSGGTPAAATYTVGGTITGLTASGLSLLDSGGDALTVPANATTFNFATAVTSGSAYAVTVQTQPTGQNCVVTNGSGTVNTNVTTAGVSCGNVVTVVVVPGPADPQNQTFNIPLTSVTVCQSGANHCATINNVLVDTGSSGLRLMASVLAANGLTLTPMLNNGNTLEECLPYVDGYTWGSVATATIVIGGETTSPIPVQVIDDRAQPSPAAPNSCTAYGTSLSSVNAFDANGVMGVGVFNQDCGPSCASTASNNIYYSCTASGTCTSTTQSLANQVSNPVASFPVDNNGVLLQLPSITATGAPTATGSLVFGIGTHSNNGLGSATVLTVDVNGNFLTTYGAQTLGNSYIDSGSNGLYFPDTTLSSSLCGSSGGAEDFYCPNTLQSLSATNQGENGIMSTVSFQIANLNTISTSNFAIDDVGGPAAAGTFDWGLPFFYGRTVFTVIAGTTAGGVNGAYAY